LTLPNPQFACTLRVWLSSQLLGVYPYPWKVMTSIVDDLFWLINVHPKSQFSLGVLSPRLCFSSLPTQETPLKTHN
jgi:hypothetical protein